MDKKMSLSVIIPAFNEEEDIADTVRRVCDILYSNHVPFEIVVVDDYSFDNTANLIRVLAEENKHLRCILNDYPKGFGYAVRKGLDVFQGDIVAIVMGDGSDDPSDIVKYYRKIVEGYDCVFGSRFSAGSKVVNYPFCKLLLNRLGNWFIRILFRIRYNDITNAFKCYTREVIDNIRPLRSASFDLTVEMPLKAIIKGYKWCVIPINWYGRKEGASKWKIKELGAQYMAVIFYVWFKKIWGMLSGKRG